MVLGRAIRPTTPEGDAAAPSAVAAANEPKRLEDVSRRLVSRIYHDAAGKFLQKSRYDDVTDSDPEPLPVDDQGLRPAPAQRVLLIDRKPGDLSGRVFVLIVVVAIVLVLGSPDCERDKPAVVSDRRNDDSVAEKLLDGPVVYSCEEKGGPVGVTGS
jgi:hypothetical protein